MPAVTPVYLGHTYTGRADGATVIGGRFVKVIGPTVLDYPNGDPVKIAHATAATEAIGGVALYDALDDKVTTYAGIGSRVPVQCSAAISAGSFVTSTADGKAVTVSGRATATGIAASTTTAADQFVVVDVI